MGRNLVFALQQLLAIIAATVLVPILVNSGTGTSYLSQASALIGAGVGTLIYLSFTKFRSPVFLGSSFAFITPLCVGALYGYCGIILGSIFAGSVYVIIALVVKKVGVEWLNKLMPPVVIGPTVALIGLSLSGSAINNVTGAASGTYNLLYILVGIATFLITIIASSKGGKNLRMFPFVIGVLGGYVLAALITVFGYHIGGSEYCKVIDFSVFASIADFSNWLPNITVVGAFRELFGSEELLLTGSGVVTLLIAFAPVALVTFAEHVADHKNISTII